MPDTQIPDEMVDAFIAAFNSGVFDKAPFGLPIDERCRCKKCLQEEADARSTVRDALEAALSGHVVGWRTMDTAPKDGTVRRFEFSFRTRAFWDDELDRWVLVFPLRVDYLPSHARYLPAPPVPEMSPTNPTAGAS